MMSEIGNGADAMAAKMIKAGAYIGPETSKRLDEMADAAERASLRWRAVFANMISAAADWYDRNKTLVNLVTAGLAGMVEIIGTLVAKGHAYAGKDGVLFHVPSMADYGKLSGRSRDDMVAGARVEVDAGKRDPSDFALWKAAKPGEPA